MSTFMDIKPVKSIYELTIGELMLHYSDEFKRKNNIILGTRIPVKYEMDCWTCHTPFLTTPYQSYCSSRCQDIGELAENDWRME